MRPPCGIWRSSTAAPRERKSTRLNSSHPTTPLPTLSLPTLFRSDLIFRQVFLDAAGSTLFEVDLAALWAGVGESRALSRADLQQVLLTSVGGEVRYETAVRDLEIVDGGAKRAEEHTSELQSPDHPSPHSFPTDALPI